MFHILVAEDDLELRDLFCTVLSDSGYLALPVSNGEEALALLEHEYVDLIISDIMMPKMDGFELISQLRAASYAMPILIITARGAITDKRTGFRAGTDDYMVKPVDVNEMLWRIEALLRRSQAIAQRHTSLGQTHFNCDTLTVCRGDAAAELPQKEFFLLYRMISSPGKIFTRRQLLDEIWGIDSETDPHTLDVHISRLRERFRDNPDFEIVTVRGLGYKAVRKDG